MILPVTIGDFISSSESIRGGRPVIAGTGVTVKRIVGWYQQGLSPEEIAVEIPHLSLAQVFAALTYYHANRQEIEDDLNAEIREAAPLDRASKPSENAG